MDLASLGWNDHFAAALARLNDPALVAGRVVNEDRHAFILITAAGEISATVSGRFLHHVHKPSELPKIGDWLALAPVPGETKGIIQHVLPRRTSLGRRLPGREAQEQVLAANIDTAFIVQALDATFKPRRLERFLVMAHEGGVRPVVILNKSDLCADVDRFVAETRAVTAETPVIVTSAQTRRGLKQVTSLIHPAETVVFIGTSGVGKSSLINRLYGDEIQATIEVRERDSKGRHTTSWRELIPLPNGGLVIDTPGMRELQVWLADEGLDDAFPEIHALAPACRFRDCRHELEPGCAVRTAADSGTLPRARYQAFLKLQHERKYLADERREHTYLVRKRQTKVVALRGAKRFNPNQPDED